MVYLALILGTLASEDLACISAGLLVREGRIGFAAATAACALGILLGDAGLWGIGRLSSSALGRWPAVSRYLEKLPTDETRRWLDDHAGIAMIASRFMPGSRLPLYVCAGIVGMPFRQFTAGAAIAVLLWTPAVVWLASTSGDVVINFAPGGGALGWATRLVSVAGLLLALKSVGQRLARQRGLAVRVARWSRWEFWPMWLFYAPVAIWVLWLSVRHRGISAITASNPGIPDGGVVGESKFRILTRLPTEWTVPSARVEAATPAERLGCILAIMRQRTWVFPIVLKPDVGQRGAGVKLARATADIAAYLAVESEPIVIQPFHPGPFEAGIFYYRLPGDARGRIFSITDKHFPQLVGDGRSTLEALIWTHPRYRLQAGTFLSRHRCALERVLAPGERFQLAIAGNHAQGTLFRDGSHLWTPPLERRIDEIAQSYPGFFVGRFDVRYTDRAAFEAGEDLAIVELNGATAESTNIYDPARSLIDAYRTLFTQWSIVFAIGAANRASGAPVTGMRRLIHMLRAHVLSPTTFAVSD